MLAAFGYEGTLPTGRVSASCTPACRSAIFSRRRHAADEDLGDVFVHAFDCADVAEGGDDFGADGAEPTPSADRLPPLLCKEGSCDSTR